MNQAKNAPAPAKVGATKTIGRVKAAEMINGMGGRIFTATFTKQNGETRTMNCRRGVNKGVKGSSKVVNTEALGMITVFDMQSGKFRKMNLQTMKTLKTGGVTYKVK